VSHNAVVVLDGASSPDATQLDGAWIAETLGRDLVSKLDRLQHLDLADILYQAIAEVRDRHNLASQPSPSTTVSVIRWNSEHVDGLVLGDSPIIVELTGGGTDALVDERLARLPRRAEFETSRWRDLVAYERTQRNRPGGYWIADGSPEAAHHALVARWPKSDVVAILAMTDGVSDCLSRFNALPGWSASLAVARRSLPELLSIATRAEDADPDCRRWPRHKRRDDKAAAFVTFTPP
jgi:hypothetical protein